MVAGDRSMSLAAIAGALGGAGLGAAGGILNNERNLSFQRETQEYLKDMQQKVFDREDSAIRRRVNDLKLAGLHPTLAAGSAAAASAPVKIDPMNSVDGTGLQAAIAGASSGAQTQQSIMNQEVMQSQISLNQANAVKAAAQSGLLGVQSQIGRKEWGLDPGSDMILHPKYDESWGKRLNEFADIMARVFGKKPKDGKPGVDARGVKVRRKGWLAYPEDGGLPYLDY